VCFIVHKTTSELERMILTTLYLAGAKKHRQIYIATKKLNHCIIKDSIAAKKSHIDMECILWQNNHCIATKDLTNDAKSESAIKNDSLPKHHKPSPSKS
jgi:hypothetical protein